MDFLEFDLSNLIPAVHAQDLDGLLQPTFGPLELDTGGGTTSSITLTASSTNVTVGESFDMDIEIKTGAFTINEYRIVIDFNPTRLTVVDADTTTSGTQIEFLDTVFEVDEGDNTVSTAGRITLIAKTPTGNALQVNRKVATIRFQSQTIGSTTVSGVTGPTGSQLINQNGVAIASTINNVTLTSSTQSTSSSSSSSSTSSSSSSTSSGTVPIISPGQSIPDTALGDDILTLLPVLSGIFLVALGVLLSRSRNEKKN